jgi:hypothetical protein
MCEGYVGACWCYGRAINEVDPSIGILMQFDRSHARSWPIRVANDNARIARRAHLQPSR